MRRILVVTVP